MKKIMVDVIEIVLMLGLIVGGFMLTINIVSMINTIKEKSVDGKVDTYKIIEYSNGNLEYNLEYVEKEGKLEFHIGF